MSKPIIVVVGATGAQGGAVAKALVNNGKFAVRGLTRDPNAAKAKAIAAEIGCELVAANLDDKASLVSAFSGCHGAFLLTNFWETLDVEKEMAQMRTLADAAKESRLKHVVFSSLDSATEILASKGVTSIPKIGDFCVPHYDTKGMGMKYFREQGVPVTELLTSFYYENFINFGMGPKSHAEGQPKAITFNLADKPLAMVAVEDIGKMAAKLLEDETTIGKTFGVASAHLTGQQMADIFTEVLGEKVIYNSVPREVYASFGFPGAEDLANMFAFKVECNDYYCGIRDLNKVKAFVPDIVDFKAWVSANKAKF